MNISNEPIPSIQDNSEAVLPEPNRPIDKKVFSSELTQLIPHLRAFSRSLCGNATLADDLAQDALLKAWKAYQSYKPGTNMKAWLFTILRNEYFSQKRRSWRTTSLEPSEAEQTIVANNTADQGLELNELRRAMDVLPDNQRIALVLVGASGMTYAEAAEICGCAIGTVKSRVNRARESLVEIMASGNFEKSSDGVESLDAIEAFIDDADLITNKVTI